MSHSAYAPTIQFLEKEGYRPERVREDVMKFRAEGGTYVLMFDQEDTAYVRLIFPSFWEIKNDFERERVVSAADQTNQHIKVAKVFTVGNDVYAAIELFLPNADHFPQVFDQALSALKAAASEFRDKAKESKRDLQVATAVPGDQLH